MTQQLTYPAVTEESISNLILRERYHWFPGTTVTTCCLTLRSGFHVIGYSACVDPERFNQETGRQEAYKHARSKIWELEDMLRTGRALRLAMAREER